MSPIAPPDNCQKCGDVGYVVELSRVYWCTCEKGKQQQRELFSPRDRKHRRPIRIAEHPDGRAPQSSGRERACGEKDE